MWPHLEDCQRDHIRVHLTDTVEEGTVWLGERLEKNNFWKLSTLLFGGVIHLIGDVGLMRRPEAYTI